MLCDRCHKHEATCHTTTIVNGGLKKADLCYECFEASGPAFARSVADSLRGARCQFCGARAAVGSMDHLALGRGEQCVMRFCQACSAEFDSYTALALKQMTGQLSQRQQLQAVQQLRVNAEQHMKEWVSKRQVG